MYRVVKTTTFKSCGATDFHKGTIVKIVKEGITMVDVKTVSGKQKMIDLDYLEKHKDAEFGFKKGIRNVADI